MLEPLPGNTGPGVNPQKWLPSHLQVRELLQNLADLRKEEPAHPLIRMIFGTQDAHHEGEFLLLWSDAVVSHSLIKQE